MHSLSLNGKWQVRAEPLACAGVTGCKRVGARRGDWLDAVVPGEIHLDLMRAGQMEEPLFGRNAWTCRWPEKKSWWYRRRFTASRALLAQERQELVLDGVDGYGQVFLNGEQLGEVTNALVPSAFDVRHRLKPGRNELLIRVTVGSERAPHPPDARLGTKPADPWATKTGWDGRMWLRKPQFTYGWDWVDALPNIGLWRDVALQGRSGAVLQDLRCDTLLQHGKAHLGVQAIVENLHPWASRDVVLELRISPPRGAALRRRLSARLQPGRQSLAAWFELEKPRLWWPRGLGDQPLHHVEAVLTCEGVPADRREFAYGLRTVEIDQAPLREGRRFGIRVNGEDVFCKGGNWIPADAIIARTSPAKYRELLEAAAEANINMLRVWGGGIYESDIFYETCDRLGILVWQDFMFACGRYPDHDAGFRAEVRREAEAAVLRLRHHACIALWSGSNENNWGFAEWWNKGKGGFEKDIQLGGREIYNRILPDVCRTLDPGRPYWPGSPCGGSMPNSELEGDCHWWHPGTMNPDVSRRIRHEIYDECRSRFTSEYGVIGPCHVASMRKYLRPAELAPGTKSFLTHTNWFEKGTTPEAIRHHYADPEALALADYVLYGQMFQATMYGRSVEAMRFRKYDAADDCQGALIWMYADCWGETGWTLIDYYLARKPSYYWFKRACAPVRAIVRRRGRRLVTRVVNDTRENHAATIHVGWLRLDGSEDLTSTRRLRIPPNSMVEVSAQEIPPRAQLDPRAWLYAARLEGDGIDGDASTWFLEPFRRLALAAPSIEVRARGRRVVLQSKVYCHGVHVDDNGRRMLSDNYFDLLPGVPRVIERVDGKPAVGLKFRAVRPR